MLNPWVSLIHGPAAAETPAESAPGPHLPPDATDDAHPTSAWPATFSKYSAVPNAGAWAVIFPTALNAIAVTPAMTADLSARAKLPVVTPVTIAAEAAATKGRKAPHPGVSTHTVMATIWKICPRLC